MSSNRIRISEIDRESTLDALHWHLGQAYDLAQDIKNLRPTCSVAGAGILFYRAKHLTEEALGYVEQWVHSGPLDMQEDVRPSAEACRSAVRMVRFAEREDWSSLDRILARLEATSWLVHEAFSALAGTIDHWGDIDENDLRRRPVQRRPDPESVRREWQRMQRTVASLIFQRDDHTCVDCRTRVNLTVDHIKPIAKGGLNTLENLRTLCRSCNARKGDRE